MYQPTSEDFAAIMTFGKTTLIAWVEAGLIKANSYGFSLFQVTEEPMATDFGFRKVDSFAYDHPRLGLEPRDGEEPIVNNGQWYVDNADGKFVICNAFGANSGDVINDAPGLVVGLEGAFPWPGGVIDIVTFLGVSTSGGTAPEDELFSSTVLNFAKVRIDARGTAALQDARDRGKTPDRFTRAVA